MGTSGYLCAELLRIRSLDEREYLLAAGYTDAGEVLDGELLGKLFSLPAVDAGTPWEPPAAVTATLDDLLDAERARCRTRAEAEDTEHFEREYEKMERWAHDRKLGLERELTALDQEIQLRYNESLKIAKLADKVRAKRAIAELESRRDDKKSQVDTERRRIDAEKFKLLDDIAGRLVGEERAVGLFLVRWGIK